LKSNAPYRNAVQMPRFKEEYSQRAERTEN
jgi:hypothetical protein